MEKRYGSQAQIINLELIIRKFHQRKVSFEKDFIDLRGACGRMWSGLYRCYHLALLIDGQIDSFPRTAGRARPPHAATAPENRNCVNDMWRCLNERQVRKEC